MNEDFKDWLQKELDERGWSYRDLEAKAGVSKALTGHIITGRRNVTFDYCVAIARSFGYSPIKVLLLAGLLEASDLEEGK